MLDDNLPTFRLRQSSDNPQNTLLYFTHNGSEPSPEYLLKRPLPSESRNQYALGLLDVNHPSVIYAEVLLKPEWTQPSLSAAELRAQNGVSTPFPMTPEAFNVLLYNPDQSIAVKRNHGSWSKSNTWDLEVPERSFKVPSSSQIDRDTTPAIPELAPKVVFRWKKDGRLSKDMTCYMSGRSVGGKKSKEPDITIAMFQAGKNESAVTIYEPNMARVEVEDRKGLEVALILSAEVIRDLYLVPRQDPFNTTGGPGPSAPKTSRPSASPPQQMPMASGALGPGVSPAVPGAGPPALQSSVDAETRRLQAMVAEEKRQAREREKRDEEEQKRIRKMLEQEEKERRRREAEVEKETERLRKQYGVPAPPTGGPPGSSPALPPRPGQNQYYASGGLGSGQPPMPPRPNSVGPPPQPESSNAGGRRKHSGPFGGSVSGLFHRSDEDRRNKVEKKRSVYF
ncbi:hypothetical protein X797_000853 [Metarhizium robertsii]|uniref:Uncharacterized protein n=2 Tax=Metarhizium robertsii TaxID=568076 RepID=E9ER16_METRA|nr:uncharacterized protein MAA_02465 [Metarhizium robertsii ARSEF 23]EFZ02883.1 hypothetical protein MAA_02465 [Metarhizium robertsii ARSEF 23]EXV06136.1 hypothetical protein X797_000853 [Metarhizium robertsii]